MNYDYLKNNGNTFYEVKNGEIDLLQNTIGISLPSELVSLWKNIGYGFLHSENNNVNRIMDPLSVMDFRLRQGDFVFQPDLKLYDEFEDGKLIFFEGNESSYLSIGYSQDNIGKVFYYDAEVADCLDDFFMKLKENDMYYAHLL